MSTSTNAVLFYGYNLGGGEVEWDIEEAGEYGEFESDWFNPDSEDADFIEDAMKRILAANGFTETDWRVDGYHKRKREAEARIGVEVDSHCSGDYPIYYLAAHQVTAWRGDAKKIDFAALETKRADEDWDGRLHAAVEALGMTPNQAPGWLLVSYWG